MIYRLGLTGSIGMGKSTTARFFAEEGCAIWDADAAVHRLYNVGGEAVEPMRALAPAAVVDGVVSRDRLKQMISSDPDVLKQIEAIVHPLVAKDRRDFIGRCDSDIAVFDIPLLFETGGDRAMDATVCVTTTPEQQRARQRRRPRLPRRRARSRTPDQIDKS